MSDQNESDQLATYAKWAVGFFLLFVFSWFKSCSEMHYIVSGVTTQAMIDSESDFTGGGRRQQTRMIDVRYHFMGKDNASHTGGCNVSASSWSHPDDNTVGVTYLPSEPTTSTLTSRRSKLWLIVWFAMLGVMAFWIYKIWREVEADTAKDKRYRKSA